MATHHFAQDSWVWLPDRDEAYVPARVVAGFKAGEAGTVVTEEGQVRRVLLG